MYNRETLNEIKSLLDDKFVLRGIQRITRLDYNKPFKIYEHTEPFTPKKLVKLYGETNSVMYAFVVTNANNKVNLKIKPVQIFDDGDINLNVNASTCISIGTFWTKLNFNEIRKNNTLTYVFVIPVTSRVENIQTNVINIDKITNNQDMLLDRFKIMSNHSYSVRVIPIGNISNSYSSKSYYISSTTPLANRVVIDKSGYIVYYKHLKYEQLAKQLQKQRIIDEKDKFIKSGELEKLIDKLKTVQNAVRKDLIIRLASTEFNEQNIMKLAYISDLINEVRYNIPYYNIDNVINYSTKESIEKELNKQINELISKYHTYFGNTSPYNSLITDTHKLHTSAETNILTNLI